MLVYEDLGTGDFVQTTTHFYSNNELPYTFLDEIQNPFYFYIELHNSSIFTESLKGTLNVDVLF